MQRRVTINLTHISHNLDVLRSTLTHTQKICASIKANAYGHGLIEVARHVSQKNIAYWGVATTSEAMSLYTHRLCACSPPHASSPEPETKNRTTLPAILVYGTLPVSELRTLLSVPARVEFMVGDYDYLKDIIEVHKKLSARGKTFNDACPVHLKIDTGMGRLGVLPEKWETLLAVATKAREIKIVGICSHCSDSANTSVTRTQLEQFLACAQQSEKTLRASPHIVRHIANSGAIIWEPSTHLDMVRPGIALYGASPSPTRCSASDLHLKPTMTLEGSIAQIKKIPAGHGISYGATFAPRTDTNIAIVSMGYGDGLPRALSNAGKVSIHNTPYPIVGTVCMDMCMVDLGDDLHMDASIKRGAMVEFFGNAVPADVQAAHAHTISYELFCNVSPRVARVYVQ